MLLLDAFNDSGGHTAVGFEMHRDTNDIISSGQEHISYDTPESHMEKFLDGY